MGNQCQRKKRMPEKERDNGAALNSSNTDLITGLCEDVVLGEVVPRLCRLPWNERPLLVMLNRSWNKAMAERFQMYHQGLHNPTNILSKALILSHSRQISNPADVVRPSYVLLSLWVCRPSNNNGSIDEGAITIRLPKHPFIQVQRNHFERIVCDNHRVFTFTPSAVAQENNVPQMIYNVWMVDLRDFNVHWKSLPPLPKLGNYVYASSSSLNGDESSYIWQRRYSDSSMADGWKLHRLSSTGPGNIDMNFDQWHWEYFNVNTGPPRNLNFDIMSERLPLYVEIERRFDRGLIPSPYFLRQLYRRCPSSEYILRESDYRSYVFILADGIVRGINECNLCFITVKNSGICILKVELDEERTRFVKEGEWNDFVQYWDSEIRSRGFYEMPNTQNAESQERSAIKFFRLPDPWRRNIGKQIWDENAEVVDWDSIVRVAQRGPIYGYSYLGFKIIGIP